ncbi:MAG TPA: hypothetical protein VF576_10335 [Rubricoccaceae bacterium]
MTRPTALLLVLLTTLTACGGEEADAPVDTAAVAETPTPSTPVAAETPAASPTGQTAPTAGTGDCPWLSADLATGLLGADVTVASAEAGHCRIQSDPPTYRGRVAVDPDPAFESTVAALGTPQPVSGLGERAGWISQGQMHGADVGGAIRVEQGGHVLIVTLSPANPQADLREKAVAVARAVLPQL